MREAEISKLLINWIENICDSGDYLELLRWINRPQKIFYLSWIHKSSANWDTTKSDVFKKWAEFKMKLGEKKNDRDFKAAFRNALRSKKNSLRLVEKGKEHRLWQILDKPIRPPKSEKTNNKRKPRQRRGSKKNSMTCKPVSDLSFQEPPPSPSCNSVFKDEFGSLPPCASLFHVSPSSSPLQQTDIIITDLGTLKNSTSMNDPIYGISSPNVHSSPQSPAFLSVEEPLFGISTPNAHFKPQSPSYISVNEPLYGIPSPNAHSSPCSPVQMSKDDTRHSAWNSLISFSNALPVSMSPDQEVPALDMSDYFTSETEHFQLTNQTQEFSKSNGVQWCQKREENLVSHQNFFEIMLDFEADEQSSSFSKSPEPNFNQEASGKGFFLESFDDNTMWNAPEKIQFERLVDGFDSLNVFTCHQL